jgi:adenine-specific DNA methylase
VKRFIRVAGQTQNAIKLVFADGNYIYGKEFDFNGVMISDKTSASINGSMENDKVRYAASEIYYWYDNFFLSYGVQRIKNTKDEDVKRKRNVLFVNKIKFE